MDDRTDRRNPRFVAVRRVVATVVALATGAATLAGCNPMASWTNNQAGKSLYRSGRYAEAREEFRQAAADSPRNADYIHNYATASRRAGDPATAEQAYRQALWLDPAHQPSYHGLAVTLNETGRGGDALSLLNNWATTQPYSEKPYVEMAWLQRELGDTTGAERSLRQALAIKPGHPLALANLGQIYEDTGRPGLAKTVYQRSLATDWNQPQVAGRLVRLTNPADGVSAGTVTAAAPYGPTFAAAPGTSVAYAPGTSVAYAPGTQVAYAPGPWRSPAGEHLASQPFTPDAGGFPRHPYRPNAGVPLASHPFQPNANMPLATNPFTPSQAYWSVPPAGAPMFHGAPTTAFGTTAAPYGTAAPTTATSFAPARR